MCVCPDVPGSIAWSRLGIALSWAVACWLAPSGVCLLLRASLGNPPFHLAHRGMGGVGGRWGQGSLVLAAATGRGVLCWSVGLKKTPGGYWLYWSIGVRTHGRTCLRCLLCAVCTGCAWSSPCCTCGLRGNVCPARARRMLGALPLY